MLKIVVTSVMVDDQQNAPFIEMGFSVCSGGDDYFGFKRD
jgi:hypothetical protein